MNLQPLQQSLTTHGLYLRGVARLSTEEIGRWGFGNELASPGVALVGNIGSSYWPEFSQSSEYRDGAANPLDRWSRRIAEEIAEIHAIAPLFPFDGPPYYPFLQWAHRAKTVATSPLGLMIHPRYGLWHSYRFGLLVEAAQVEHQSTEWQSPCLSCISQPCLAACPVQAFDTNGYNVSACAEYLESNPATDCHSGGCLARRACPVGVEFRYNQEQSQFHLHAFLLAR